MRKSRNQSVTISNSGESPAVNDQEMPDAYGGSSGGAVGGTPANKRSTGGR